ncbi:hypothetical protein OH77DRAFT_1054221 [Trametes cingulata]|nr:hypothetical protein OH77DRAFT_1054221 [Trametes cingulata]
MRASANGVGRIDVAYVTRAVFLAKAFEDVRHIDARPDLLSSSRVLLHASSARMCTMHRERCGGLSPPSTLMAAAGSTAVARRMQTIEAEFVCAGMLSRKLQAPPRHIPRLNHFHSRRFRPPGALALDGPFPRQTHSACSEPLSQMHPQCDACLSRFLSSRLASERAPSSSEAEAAVHAWHTLRRTLSKQARPPHRADAIMHTVYPAG